MPVSAYRMDIEDTVKLGIGARLPAPEVEAIASVPG
jgi:hypothetical protein